MSDLQTIQHTRLVKQRELSRLGREIARLEHERTRVIAEIVDLVEAERRRAPVEYVRNQYDPRATRQIGPFIPFGGDGAA